jgi:hypothetical protein
MLRVVEKRGSLMGKSLLSVCLLVSYRMWTNNMARPYGSVTALLLTRKCRFVRSTRLWENDFVKVAEAIPR